MFNRSITIAIVVVGVAMVIYQLISPFKLFVGPNAHQMIHLTFALLLLSLVFIKQAKRRWVGILVGSLYILLTLFVAIYSLPRISWLELHSGDPDLPFIVVIIGIILTFLALDSTRRAMGIAIPIVCTVFVVYAYAAQFVPITLFHGPPVSINRIFIRIGIGGLGANGIFGPILSLSANVVFLFFVYGAALKLTGGVKFFMEVSKAVGRKLAGGPALAAVTSSALVGMITGSPAGNVALTGSFTIPMMKKVGYAPYQAGAIESTASTGGTIMPPVMGLVAFIMAAMTGIPYIQICLMALLPAVLYFTSAGFYAQFSAMKLKARGILVYTEEEHVSMRNVLLYGPLFILPLILLIVFLIMGFSLGYTIALTIFFLFAISLVRKETRPSLKQLIEGLSEGAVNGSGIAVTTASIGVILGALSFTVLAPRIPTIVTSIAGGHLFAMLVLTAVSSLILGMGTDILIAYIIVVLVVSPALLGTGVVSIAQAHFFCLYFSIIGFVTPPVAPAAIVGARVAGSPFLKTAVEASKVAFGGFLIPFCIIYCPFLIFQPGIEPILGVPLVIGAFMLVIAAQVTICGQYMTPLGFMERSIFGIIAAAIFVSFPLQSSLLIYAGIGAFILATLWQWRKIKSLTPAPG
jgi:TRAP transporter 4TM/12TM fusion protein